MANQFNNLLYNYCIGKIIVFQYAYYITVLIFISENHIMSALIFFMLPYL
jgi:hypothetical protein